MKINYFKSKTYFFLFFFLVSVTGFGQDISADLPSFSEIKTFNGVEVVLIPAKENNISITGHSKENVKFEVKENRLEIKLSLDNIWADDNTVIKVYFSSVETVDANENSVVQFFEVIKGENLVFRAQEGAFIFGEVKADRISAKAVTGGKIEIRGKAKKQDIEINTGGQFYGEHFKSKETHVSISAGGRAEIYASEYCKATSKLGGNIYIYGNPALIDQKTSLGGKVIKMK